MVRYWQRFVNVDIFVSSAISDCRWGFRLSSSISSKNQHDAKVRRVRRTSVCSGPRRPTNTSACILRQPQVVNGPDVVNGAGPPTAIPLWKRHGNTAKGSIFPSARHTIMPTYWRTQHISNLNKSPMGIDRASGRRGNGNRVRSPVPDCRWKDEGSDVNVASLAIGFTVSVLTAETATSSIS